MSSLLLLYSRTGPRRALSLKLSDTRVYEPEYIYIYMCIAVQIQCRTRLGRQKRAGMRKHLPSSVVAPSALCHCNIHVCIYIYR